MKKLEIKRRGFNSRRMFRKLNSVTELVGKEVEVTDADTLTETEVAEVKVDQNQDVTLGMANGDEVVLDQAEAEELLETGSVAAEDEVAAPTEDFEVTREVVDADGNVNEVTTKVEAESEGDAIKTVELLDSRRGRANNSRNYRASKVQVNATPRRFRRNRVQNSDPSERVVKLGCGECEVRYTFNGDVLAKAEVKCPESEDFTAVEIPQIGQVVTINDLEKCGNDAVAAAGKNCKTNSREFKITRTVSSNGKKFRKVASVNAPSLEEAIEAVQVKDNADEIQADGYEELVEKEPTTTVTINSDVEEEILEMPAEETAVETSVETEEAPAESAAEPAAEEAPAEPAAEETVVEPTTPETEIEEPVEEEVDRESNSFKGVADFVKRKYGVNI